MKKRIIKALCWIMIFQIAESCFIQGAARASAPVTVEGAEKISLDIKGMDIIEVLKILASELDESFVIDKNVSGRVTVFLKDVPPQGALEAILASNDLVREKQHGVTRIMTGHSYQERHGSRHDDLKEMCRVGLKYLRPQDIVGVLNNLKSGIGNIVVDEISGAVILFDTKEKNLLMRELIEEMDKPLETQVFDLNYALVEKIQEKLQDVLTKGVGRMKVDDRSNKLIVTDYPSRLQEAAGMIAALDERTREVQIDAKIIQVGLSDKTSYGIDWEYIVNKKFSVKGMFGEMVSTTGNTWTVASTVLTEPKDYQVIIEALETIGETRILSSPKLTVANNKEARIMVGSKQVYVTTAALQSQTTTETAETVNFVDVGVKLIVEPQINADGFIAMRVGLEVSSVVHPYTTASGNTIPVVETSEAETTVLVQDGSTVIIGGLMKEEDSQTINKIPILGDLPLLGCLFRNTVTEKKKTELVILLKCKTMSFAPSPTLT